METKGGNYMKPTFAKLGLKLENNIKCDVLIIGGGMTGLSVAFHLMNSKKNIVLIDKGVIGKGITSNSTGKLTIMQDVMYSKIEQAASYDKAYKYYKSQLYKTDTIIKNPMICVRERKSMC